MQVKGNARSTESRMDLDRAHMGWMDLGRAHTGWPECSASSLPSLAPADGSIQNKDFNRAASTQTGWGLTCAFT